MKTKRNYSNVPIAVCVLSSALFGCEGIHNDESMIQGLEPEDNKFESIPYASEEELTSLPNDENYVFWKRIRTVALIEFEISGVKDRLDISNKLHFSKKPVVIYDDSSMPYRHEYIVSDSSDEPVATVVTIARREKTTNVITEVLPYVRDYNAISYNNEMKMYGMKSSNANSSAEHRADESVRKISQIQPKYIEVSNPLEQLETLSDKELERLGYPERANLRVLIQSGTEKSAVEIDDFWDSIVDPDAEFARLTDDQIYAKLTDSEVNGSIQTTRAALTSKTSQYFLNRVVGGTVDRANTYWLGYCGPAALANAYLYTSMYYNGKYLGNLHLSFQSGGKNMGNNRKWVASNINSKDGGLYYDLAEKSGCFNLNGPALAILFDSAMKYVTNKRYGVSATLYNVQAVINKLKKTNLPIIWWSEIPHYVTIVGAYKKMVYDKFLIFNILKRENCYFEVYDNGWETQDNSFKPVQKSINCGGGNFYFTYPVVKR